TMALINFWRIRLADRATDLSPTGDGWKRILCLTSTCSTRHSRADGPLLRANIIDGTSFSSESNPLVRSQTDQHFAHGPASATTLRDLSELPSDGVHVMHTEDGAGTDFGCE